MLEVTDLLLNYEIGEGVEAFSTRRDAALPYHVITGHQVHGCKVAVVDDPSLTREDLEGYDALVTNLEGCAIGVRTADCIPVLLYDSVHRAVAAIHSGWKGTVQKISLKVMRKMAQTYGTQPSDLKAVIGPGICRSCFQVGEEVVQFFKEAGFPIESIWTWDGMREETNMKGGHHLDLVEANRWLLSGAGVDPANILVSGVCSYENEEFFSARREGFDCGRTINAIKLV